MIHHVVQFALRQRLLVLLVVAFIAVGGAISFHHMPVDAYPIFLHRWLKSSRSGPGTRRKKSNAWLRSQPKWK